jgi:nicotinate-nucleotide--dimethylbenzimidazole phosphoribosyltransferase
MTSRLTQSDREDALSEDELTSAWDAGTAIADQHVDEGAQLLIVGDMGIANTTPIAAVLSSITGIEPVALIGRGTGIDDLAWMRKAEAIRDAVHRSAESAGDPLELLRRCGGADIVAATAFMLQAAVRRTPILIDGVISAVCGLVAARIEPGAQQWWVAGHRSTEPAQTRALAELKLEPILELDMRLGEGTGALTALPVLQAAIAMLAEMATFDEAGVSDR